MDLEFKSSEWRRWRREVAQSANSNSSVNPAHASKYSSQKADHAACAEVGSPKQRKVAV